MPYRQKVIKGFTVCTEHGLLNGEDCHGHYEYTDNLADIIKVNDYSKQCPYNGCRTGCVKTLAMDAIALLKEKEAIEPDVDSEGTCTCGNCGENVGWYPVGSKEPVRLCKFCSECGQEVKWE